MHVALEQSCTGNIYMIVAHAIKPKATYCLSFSWGSTTTAARSPTSTRTRVLKEM